MSPLILLVNFFFVAPKPVFPSTLEVYHVKKFGVLILLLLPELFSA